MGKNAQHMRVLNHVLARIRDGTYPPGSRLPSESSLAETLSVSRSTVTRATERLRWVGLVVGPAGGIARVASEPRRSAALELVERADQVRSMPE